MRILHTADWHLGKLVNGYSMIEDQAYYFDALIEELKTQDIDVLLMAGDLYDRSLPPKEAVALADSIFTRIRQELGIPIVAIAGNHDSKERVSYAGSLLASSGLHIEGRTLTQMPSVLIDKTRFWLLPFADPIQLKAAFDDDAIKDIQDGVKAQIDAMKDQLDPDEINVLVYHGYVIKGTADSVETSESERPLTIGTAEYVQSQVFADFDYVALGHLHKAQRVDTDRMRYSGSPLKYSKSEAKHKKQALIVDISKDHLQVQPLFIQPLRDMRVVQGSFEDLMAEASEDYVFIELTDTAYVLDAMNRLRQAYPNAMSLEYVNLKRQEDLDLDRKKSEIKNQSLTTLFENFYEEVTDGQMDAARLELVKQVAQEVKEADDATP